MSKATEIVQRLLAGEVIPFGEVTSLSAAGEEPTYEERALLSYFYDSETEHLSLASFFDDQAARSARLNYLEAKFGHLTPRTPRAAATAELRTRRSIRERYGNV